MYIGDTNNIAHECYTDKVLKTYSEKFLRTDAGGRRVGGSQRISVYEQSWTYYPGRFVLGNLQIYTNLPSDNTIPVSLSLWGAYSNNAEYSFGTNNNPLVKQEGSKYFYMVPYYDVWSKRNVWSIIINGDYLFTTREDFIADYGLYSYTLTYLE